MSKVVKIPETMNPFVVVANHKEYVYPAGTEQEVPDEVAEIIENHTELQPEPDPNSGGNVDYDLVIESSLELELSLTNATFTILSGSAAKCWEKAKNGGSPKVKLIYYYYYGDVLCRVEAAESIQLKCQSDYDGYVEAYFRYGQIYLHRIRVRENVEGVYNAQSYTVTTTKA